MILYVTIGLMIGFYITATTVMPQISDAKESGCDNALVRNPVLSAILNVVLIGLIWPIFIPYFFSMSFEDKVKEGFSSAINTDD